MKEEGVSVQRGEGRRMIVKEEEGWNEGIENVIKREERMYSKKSGKWARVQLFTHRPPLGAC